MSKFVCVGLGKTGTTTFGACMKVLGFKHRPGNTFWLRQLQAGDTDELMDIVDRFDSFDDFPFPYMYKEIDRRHPGSKFILTVRRNVEAWYDSLCRHCDRYPGDPQAKQLLAYGMSSPHDDKKHHIDLYLNHLEDVRQYFKDRPQDLLEVCWEHGDEWEKLCGFLGVEVPDRPFPKANADPRDAVVREIDRLVALGQTEQVLELISKNEPSRSHLEKAFALSAQRHEARLAGGALVAEAPAPVITKTVSEPAPSRKADPMPAELNLAPLLTDELRNLRFDYEEGDPQKLTVRGRTIVVPHSAAPAAEWMRKKHKLKKDGARAIHEPGTLAAFLTLLRLYEARTIFDVGSLYGYFSLLLAAQAPEAKICAFEMNPRSFAQLQAVVAANGFEDRIEPLNMGVSDRTQMVNAHITGFKLREQKGETPIQLTTLDDFGRAPDLMKIDVEGYQAKIIPGGMKMIASAKPLIVMELDEAETVGQFGKTNKEIVEPLFALGYNGFWCEDHRTTAGEFEAVTELEPRHEINSLLVLVHPDRPRR